MSENRIVQSGEPNEPTHHGWAFFVRRNWWLLAVGGAILMLGQVNCHYWNEPRVEPPPPSVAEPQVPLPPASLPADLAWAHRPIAPTTSVPPAMKAPPTVRVRVGPDRPTALVSTTGPYRILVDGKLLLQASAPLSPTALARREGLWRLGTTSAPGQTLLLVPADDTLVKLDKTLYRGSLHLHPAGPGLFFAVNHLDLENYLAGVLARELFKDWHGETYRALSIAARTYAYYEATANPKGGPFDVYDSQASQVYGGYSGETPVSRAAAASTRGLVLMTPLNGRHQVFRAYYSSCCGGRTNSAEVLRNEPPAAPLRGGILCDDCRVATRYRWPAVRLAKRDLYDALVAPFPAVRSIGALKGVRVYSSNRFGRPVWLDLLGPKGKSIRLLADDLRIAALRAQIPGADKLYSMNCTIVDNPTTLEFRDGRGFGHGVGLCQWGAQGKALAGWTAERILLHYYPSTDLVRLY